MHLLQLGGFLLMKLQILPQCIIDEQEEKKKVFISHYSNYTSFTFATNPERVHKHNKVNT
jgi:hypothetical protein